MPAPDAPTNLAVAALSTSEIAMTWDDITPSESQSIRVEYGTAADFVGATAVALLPLNDPHSITGLLAGTLYYFRIRVFDELATPSVSDWSNTASATTIAASNSSGALSLSCLGLSLG